MGRPAIQDQILEDLEKLPRELQRRVQQLVHAMVVSITDTAPDVLRFAIDDPLSRRDRKTEVEPGPLLPPEM